ncbi:CHRD domain-containing protein [Aggregicoccus sp. 17bor-14]|uniref:CHRD domain-containing protein n=1 Tax=Myxococcaceae TaxID=31 RepID=UPI00129CC87B|nr:MULTISPECIES: CHRD domain-containing protein [Myxococcaceae]MBF5043267.1 CHRD domain-containing protein [Simulacricoccus sp. 17bor-14]MRI89024.1 CHRD domain-containing protein [Aggregicoccus sp. 17bor-14]
MGRRAVAAVLGMLALAGCDNANELKASMTGPQERPTPVVSGGTGEAKANVKGNTVVVAGVFDNLTSTAIAAHIHGPADKDTAAPVLCGLTVTASSANGTSGTIGGTCDFSDAQIEQLKDGQTYINVHTQNYPDGEIRGQLE